MEWGHQGDDHHSHVQMLQKPSNLLSFLGRRSFVPRPLSDATDFFDLDNADDSDGSTPRSLESLDDDSQTTASSRDEVTTPHSGGLGGFEFHFDEKPVEGPVGPHLFRTSPDFLSHLQDDAFLTLSPIGVRSKSPVDDFTAELLVDRSGEQEDDDDDDNIARSFTAEILIDTSNEPMPATPVKPTTRPFTSLNTAVAELDETQVRHWKPRQVAEWMADAGFEASVVEKFLIHDISGSVLLDLQFEDLKELDISSFGKRHRVMSSIHHLRNSSMISIETPLSRTPSRSNRSPRTLQRTVQPDECHVIADSRSQSRRRHRRRDGEGDIVTPAESISIVAIEQLLPKPHKCSKGEECPKWQKQQKKLLRIQQEFAEEALRPKSEAVPSVVGSSDVLGPTPPFKITAERLSEIAPRDPQENVRQFLSFQHMHGCNAHTPSPPPAASASYQPRPANLSEHLRGLPKLTIPSENKEDESSQRTPISALRNPTNVQAQLRAQLQNDPYHYGGVASPVDVYRIGTPFSASDIPVTSMPQDPCERDVSQSVPPDMRYGATANSGIPSVSTSANTRSTDPIRRCVSTQPHGPRRRTRQPSFNPSIEPVRENVVSAVETASRPPVVTTESSDLLNHNGWMRKRKTTRFLRHEWQDNYFSLDGHRLIMLDSEDLAAARALDEIDVDDYAVHAYSLATGSKLSAAFKKSILGSGYAAPSQPSFAFSLIPEPTDREKGSQVKRFEKTSGKSHHFAVKSGNERVEWMRRLMLAKAASKNDHSHTF